MRKRNLEGSREGVCKKRRHFSGQGSRSSLRCEVIVRSGYSEGNTLLRDLMNVRDVPNSGGWFRAVTGLITNHKVNVAHHMIWSAHDVPRISRILIQV
jgi:hypothetical protein